MSKEEILSLLKDGADLYSKIIRLKEKSGHEKVRFIKRNLPRFKKMWKKIEHEREQSRKKESETKNSNVHPWRVCGPGEHWVHIHPLHTRPSKKHPSGYTTPRKGHCAKNPSGKDQIRPEEMAIIASQNFSNLNELPTPSTIGYNHGNDFDHLIAGWTKYWNEVLKPKTNLDPDIVKALIASESDFEPRRLADNKNPKSGRGLLQITDTTRNILANKKKELNNHFVITTPEELNDPNVNISAGIRWLFQKQKLASHNLGRDASWEEAVYEFKGLRKANKSRATELMNRFAEKLKRLKSDAKKST